MIEKGKLDSYVFLVKCTTFQSSKSFNIKVAFVVLLSRAKYSLKDKIFTNVVQATSSEKVKFSTLNHTVQSTGTVQEMRHYTEKIRAKFIWLLNCCFPGQTQCFLSATQITWIPENELNKKSCTYSLTHGDVSEYIQCIFLWHSTCFLTLTIYISMKKLPCHTKPCITKSVKQQNLRACT